MVYHNKGIDYKLSTIEHITHLSIGDIVVIDQAHKYEFGHWLVFSSVPYEYIGRISKEYKFRNIKYKYEIFNIDELISDDGSCIIIGKLSDKRFLRQLKLKNILDSIK